MSGVIEAHGDCSEEQDGPAIRIRAPHNAGHVEAAPIRRDELQIDGRADRERPARAELSAAGADIDRVETLPLLANTDPGGPGYARSRAGPAGALRDPG